MYMDWTDVSVRFWVSILGFILLLVLIARRYWGNGKKMQANDAEDEHHLTSWIGGEAYVESKIIHPEVR